MPNRYTRDELIHIALNMVQLPNLEAHDMPDGVVQPYAFSIQWLQDILDFWYHMVPFSSGVKRIDLTIPANTGTVILPADFIIDVRNGLLPETIPGNPTSLKRTHRVSLQKFINRQVVYQTSQSVLHPIFYNIHEVDSSGRQILHVAPIPTINVVCKLWYYFLPPKLRSTDVPQFPNDYVCIEYIRIRALEQSHLYDPGTAQKFCDKIVAGMRAAGIMHEPEDDEIPFDDIQFHKAGRTGTLPTYAWMGPV